MARLKLLLTQLFGKLVLGVFQNEMNCLGSKYAEDTEKLRAERARTFNKNLPATEMDSPPRAEEGDPRVVRIPFSWAKTAKSSDPDSDVAVVSLKNTRKSGRVLSSH